MTQHAGRAAAGQRVGYARVSTVDQNLDRQLAAIGKVDRLFTDSSTGGSRAQRTGLTELITYVRAGDTVVVTSMDRLARSLRDLVAIVDEITTKGATLTFLTEGQTYRPGHTDPTSDLMLGILGSVAQFERALIRERQAEGIAAARARGVYRGRARALSEADVEQARERVAAGVPKAAVARDLGVHRSTLHRALSQ
ncbi:recombinase family protein [Actinomyces howellii]|uniref:DNA-invertase hin n=1 Tax=Actinomyces howellii TaxID=52771 RepID=A0A3S4RCF2_9ACTO|nr:recombinase family protein [Actinomyces howellii]VEG29991.1 DNA-invertase hin [Actinomyces howellii]